MCGRVCALCAKLRETCCLRAPSPICSGRPSTSTRSTHITAKKLFSRNIGVLGAYQPVLVGGDTDEKIVTGHFLVLCSVTQTMGERRIEDWNHRMTGRTSHITFLLVVSCLATQEEARNE